MAIIILLIGISLSIAILFLVIFYWNMNSGQYDDTYTPAVRILFDDEPARVQKTKEKPGAQTTAPPSHKKKNTDDPFAHTKP